MLAGVLCVVLLQGIETVRRDNCELVRKMVATSEWGEKTVAKCGSDTEVGAGCAWGGGAREFPPPPPHTQPQTVCTTAVSIV